MPAYLDFKAIAEATDIAAVADLLKLKLKQSSKELRGVCPACNTDDPRALCVYVETNSFRCFAAQKSGDCISLYAHIEGTGMYQAAKTLREQFEQPTAPQKPESRKQPAPKKEQAFDPESFASKLVYSEEVSALGISEPDATKLGIGFCKMGSLRGKVCFPVRNVDGSVAGFVGYGDGQLKLPPRWIQTNLVTFRKKA